MPDIHHCIFQECRAVIGKYLATDKKSITGLVLGSNHATEGRIGGVKGSFGIIGS
jgi:hypothetical protein